MSKSSSSTAGEDGSADPGQWLVTPRPRPGATVRLIVAPHAGGSPAWYAGWGDELPPEIELNLLHMPGRGSRHAEPAETQFESLVPKLGRALAPVCDGQYALYGHSLGALIVFELACQSRELGWQQPVHLFVSGCPAPHLISGRRGLSNLPDEAFVDEVKRLGGMPIEIMDNAQILPLLLPILKADMALFESYALRDEIPLECPIVAFGGSADDLAEPGVMEDWSLYTSARFTLRLFGGGHFFIREHRGDILRIIASKTLIQGTGG